METDPEAWVRGFEQGWRRPASADSFADHFDQMVDADVRLVQPQIPPTLGRRAFREIFARPVFTLIPDLRAEVHEWAARGDTIFIEFTLRGTLGGKPVAWRAVDRVWMRDGVATERRAFFDPGPLLVAVLTRPRAWPRFVRAQLVRLRARRG
jgi:ketosteroid isomerase-like protein